MPYFILFIVLYCCTSQLSAEKHQWQQSAYIKSSFYNLALKSEYAHGDGLLHKWQQQIRYQIKDSTGDHKLHKQLVKKQLAHLSAITGLDIKPDTPANLTIYFLSENNLADWLTHSAPKLSATTRQQLLRNSVCSARFSIAADATIQSAVVLIPVDRARAHGKLLSCIVEELSQIMGLPNDSDKVYPSIFNDYSFNDFLTGLDYVLLKLLYQPQLRSGLSQQQLDSIIDPLLNSSLFRQLIKTADTEVQQNSLQTLME